MSLTPVSCPLTQIVTLFPPLFSPSHSSLPPFLLYLCPMCDNGTQVWPSHMAAGPNSKQLFPLAAPNLRFTEYRKAAKQSTHLHNYGKGLLRRMGNLISRAPVTGVCCFSPSPSVLVLISVRHAAPSRGRGARRHCSAG